ncbi:MAG: DUF6084 family protein [Actinomycetota bacterium]|nr:DUF6084 family protein [Actinomycetota bacterium]
MSDAPEQPTDGPGTAAPSPVAVPAVTFEVLGATHDPISLAPTLRLQLGVSEASGREVYAITLTAQVNLDPARREYDAETRKELFELFGMPERWPSTTRSFVWANVETMVHSFSGAGTFSLEIPCTADLESAVSRYIEALPDGDVPITLHFSGRVMYPAEGGRLQVAGIPWSTSCSYRVPISVWQNMMKHHHGQSTILRLHKDTMQALLRYKTARGLPNFDACVAGLLEAAAIDDEENSR